MAEGVFARVAKTDFGPPPSMPTKQRIHDLSKQTNARRSPLKHREAKKTMRANK